MNLKLNFQISTPINLDMAGLTKLILNED